MKKNKLSFWHIIVYITSAFILQSCGSAITLADYKPSNKPINPKLPSMEKSIDDYYHANVQSNEMTLRIFNKEVDDNLTNPYGKKYGYIVLKTNSVGSVKCKGVLIAEACLLFFPAMLGAPTLKGVNDTESEILIYNSKHELIGRYTGTGQASQWMNMYTFQTKVPIIAFNASLDEIRVKIQADMPRIQSELDKAGPIN